MSKFSIQAALLGLPSDLQDKISQEVDQFQTKLLEKHHLKLRDDSRLVWSFLMHELSPFWTEKRVMDELCLLNYIHNETCYTEKFKSTIPIVKLNLEQQI